MNDGTVSTKDVVKVPEPSLSRKQMSIPSPSISTSHFSRSHRRPHPLLVKDLPITAFVSLKSPIFDVFDDKMGVKLYHVPYLPSLNALSKTLPDIIHAISYPSVGDDSHIRFWYLSKGYFPKRV